jgi:hypothetical protein
MTDQASIIEEDKLFQATQALSLGSFDTAQRAIDDLPEDLRNGPNTVLARLSIYDAQGSYLKLGEYVNTLLSRDAEFFQNHGGQRFIDLLRLVQARINIMTRLAVSPYVPIALSVWDKWLEQSNLTSCDKVMVSKTSATGFIIRSVCVWSNAVPAVHGDRIPPRSSFLCPLRLPQQ